MKTCERFRLFGKKKTKTKKYDKEKQEPVLRCSICNGEQVAGFKDRSTGKFTEVCLIRNETELKAFQKEYGIEEIRKEY